MAGGDYYSRVSARFWIDTKSWGERNQRVALYLLTNTHSTMEGLYHLPLGYLCADLGLTPEEAIYALRFIEDEGVVAYDDKAEVVFICKALKHGAPTTQNHRTGAVNRLRSVPASPLWAAFLMACECHASALAHDIRVALVMPLASSSSISNSSLPTEDVPSELVGSDKTEPTVIDQAPAPTKALTDDLFAYWKTECGHPKARPTAVRINAVKARLKEGYTVDEIRAGIDGAAKQPFVNAAGKAFDDLELICRNGVKLEDFIGRATYTPQHSSGVVVNARSRFEAERDAMNTESIEALKQMGVI